MQPGDKIVAVDGTQVETWEKLSYALVDRVGETGVVSIQADRAGENKLFQLPIQNYLKIKVNRHLKVWVSCLIGQKFRL